MFSQEELVNIQWDLVIANFKDPKTITLLRSQVENASFGSSSHRAGVLNVALKKAFEFKRKNTQSPTVHLRCAATFCTEYNNLFQTRPLGRTSIANGLLIPIDGESSIIYNAQVAVPFGQAPMRHAKAVEGSLHKWDIYVVL